MGEGGRENIEKERQREKACALWERENDCERYRETDRKGEKDKERWPLERGKREREKEKATRKIERRNYREKKELKRNIQMKDKRLLL